MTDLQTRVLELLAEGAIGPDVADDLLGHVGSDPTPETADVVVTGAAVRLPGIDTLDGLWDLLRSARPLTRPFPRRRLELVLGASDDLARTWGHLRDSVPTDPRAEGGWLTGLEEFAPERYGLDDFEAMFVGPNERVVLDLASEALEASCIDPAELVGSSTGVFLAHNPDSAFPYVRLFEDPDERAMLSGVPANVAYRVAYTYGLTGPVMNIDTTCSSSLVALHVARRSLQAGECDTAVVAGVNLDLLPFRGNDSTSFVLSPRRRCNAYDGSADGTWWGEGAAAVVLRRRADALRDGNPVFVGLAGSAVTSDGRSNGMMAPNPAAHADAVRAALAEAGVAGGAVGYVEGHGAGTILGDQVEVSALEDAFRSDTDERQYCSLGSVKTVTGHLKDAAGIVGLLAAALRVRHRTLPPLALLDVPTATVRWSETPFVLDSRERVWDRPGPAVAGVSSLGLSGTNAHVVLREDDTGTEPDGAAASGPEHDATPDLPPILLSAGSRRSLFEFVERLGAVLADVPSLAAVAATLARRPGGPARVALVPRSLEELATQLERLTEVRAFDRAPATFAAQGILLADTDQTRETSAAAVSGLPEEVRDLVADFVAGADVSSRYRERTAAVRPVVLPVPPPTTRRIWPAEASAAPDVRDLFFGLDWVPATDPEGSRRLGLVVVVAADRESAGAMAAALHGHSDDVVLVVAADTPSGEGDTFRGPLHRPETYLEVWERLGRDRLARLDAVLFVGDLAGHRPMSSLESLRAGQEAGAVALFAFARSAAALPADHAVVLAAVAREVHSITGREERQSPAQATTFGLLRVVSQEMPQFLELCVDVGDGDLADVGDLVAAELTRSGDLRPRQVAHRDGVRYRRVLERRPEPVGAEPPLRVEPGSVHVIGGGTGNLGPALAEFLAGQGAGTVVLLSRHPLPEGPDRDRLRSDPEWAPRLAALERTEALGCRVVHLVCDLTDAASVEQAFARMDDLGLAPSGGYMLSKQLYHQWIRDLADEDFRAGLDNRVAGTWLFAAALRAHGAEHLLLFSSISSMSGTKGAAECAAVNQYLDAAAPWYSATGLRTYTVNWALILEDRGEYKARTPIPPIDLSDFRSALARVFARPSSLDVVARIDLTEADYLRPVLRVPLGDTLWAEAAGQPDGRSLPADADTEPVTAAPRPDVAPEEGIARAWESALGETPTADAHFFGSGGSSLSVIRFVHQIAKHLGPDLLDVGDVYATPTFEQLVDAARRALAGPDPTAGAPPGAAADPAPAPGALDDLDALLEKVEAGLVSPTDAAQHFGAGGGGA